MTPERFSEILDKFGRVRIAVAGDFFLDRLFYVERDWDEPSVETGLTAYQVARRKCLPGAAGTITNNLAALGVKEIYALALTGDDGEAFDLLKGLRESGVDTSFVVRHGDIFTPTYTKTFFDYPDRKEETHRIDVKNRRPTPEEAERRVIGNLLEIERRVDAIICLEQLKDKDCGMFTDAVIETLSGISARGAARVLVDSRFNIAKFRNVIKKCNDAEILNALSAAGTDAGSSAKTEGAARFALVDAALLKLGGGSSMPFFASCGERGFKVLYGGHIEDVPAYSPPGPYDICGAGDSAMAGLACALSSGAEPVEAALFGNLVASITIQQIGVTGTATRDDVARRFAEYS
jgi:bifunctional ADP-heptose synthase (sugar kinase/adenylyltransferase)